MFVDGLRRTVATGLVIVAAFLLAGPAFAFVGVASRHAVSIQGGTARLLVDVLLGIVALRASRRLWPAPAPKRLVGG